MRAEVVRNIKRKMKAAHWRRLRTEQWACRKNEGVMVGFSRTIGEEDER